MTTLPLLWATPLSMLAGLSGRRYVTIRPTGVTQNGMPVVLIDGDLYVVEELER